MHTLSFQAPEELYEELNKYAKELDRSKGYLIRAALVEYMQDIEDVMDARRIQGSYTSDELVSFDDIKRQNKLD